MLRDRIDDFFFDVREARDTIVPQKQSDAGTERIATNLETFDPPRVKLQFTSQIVGSQTTS